MKLRTMGRVRRLKKRGTGRHLPEKQGQYAAQGKYDRQRAGPAREQDCPDKKSPKEGEGHSALASQSETGG
jgi:hypothetical protein